MNFTNENLLLTFILLILKTLMLIKDNENRMAFSSSYGVIVSQLELQCKILIKQLLPL